MNVGSRAEPYRRETRRRLLAFCETLDADKNKEVQLAVRPPQRHLSHVKMTLNMVVNIPK